MQQVRRPWEITPEERVAVGEALSQIPAGVWEMMDYYLGFLAAGAFTTGNPEVADSYLGTVGALKAVVAGLPEARKEATREFDSRRLVGAAASEASVDLGDEPTPEELRDAATRAARLSRL